jgi:hypothetical protein
LAQKRKNSSNPESSKPKDALPWLNKTVFVIMGGVILAAVYFGWISSHETGKTVSTVTANPELLPGLQLGEAPWEAELIHLRERLNRIGLPALTEEGSALHIHQHLDIFIHGKAVAVPAAIGFNAVERFISPIHTHDANGVIHIESPTVHPFTLGQFLDVWGVRLSSNCIGAYCANQQDLLKTYINGQPISGDPRSIVLAEHQVIVVTFGSPAEEPKAIPAQFQFPPGS